MYHDFNKENSLFLNFLMLHKIQPINADYPLCAGYDNDLREVSTQLQWVLLINSPLFLAVL